MKNKKLKLDEIKVQSFSTSLVENDKSMLHVQGGKTGLYCSLLGEGCDGAPNQNAYVIQWLQNSCGNLSIH